MARLKWLAALAVVLALCMAGPATANMYGTAMNISSTSASGAMGTAALNTGDRYIGCWASSSGGTPLVTCEAWISGATIPWKTCTTTNGNILAVLHTVTSEAFISFEWDSQGNCSKLVVQPMSYMELK